jgi:hypothetical protein
MQGFSSRVDCLSQSVPKHQQQVSLFYTANAARPFSTPATSLDPTALHFRSFACNSRAAKSHVRRSFPISHTRELTSTTSSAQHHQVRRPHQQIYISRALRRWPTARQPSVLAVRMTPRKRISVRRSVSGMSLASREAHFFTDRNCSDINDFNKVITILVGSEEQSFMVHQDLICDKSRFFKAACSDHWREGQDRVVRLPNIDPIAFKAYCGWVYSGELPKNTCTPTSSVGDKVDEQRLLVDLYILGDKLDDLQMRNQANSQLLDTMHRQRMLCNPGTLKRVYASTPPGSLLRRMLVDVTLARQRPSSFAEKISLNPA